MTINARKLADDIFAFLEDEQCPQSRLVAISDVEAIIRRHVVSDVTGKSIASKSSGFAEIDRLYMKISEQQDELESRPRLSFRNQ